MKLSPVVRPLVHSTMTRAELVRAAEQAFPRPSRIISLMLGHLRNDLPPLVVVDGRVYPQSSTLPAGHTVNCPCCGAELHVAK